MEMNQAKRVFFAIAKPKAFLFGVAVAQFVWMLAFVVRYELEFPVPAEHWNPVRVMWEPALVLLAALMLLIGGVWKYVLSIVSSAWVIYQLWYLGLVSVSAAHDIPLFSLEVPRRWLGMMYVAQPQYILQIILSAIIGLYAGFLLLRRSSGKLA
jgi:hypothetical protein